MILIKNYIFLFRNIRQKTTLIRMNRISSKENFTFISKIYNKNAANYPTNPFNISKQASRLFLQVEAKATILTIFPGKLPEYRIKLGPWPMIQQK